MPSVQATTGVVVVEEGRILLVRRADDGSWCLPGGRLEVGESLRAGAAREFTEETGRAVELGRLLGVYSDPDQQTHRYPDGAVVQFVAVVFSGRAGPEVAPVAGDTTEVAWFGATELPEPLMATDAPIILDALAGRFGPLLPEPP
jgi:ADP-ribose pyrophosphatase YjhB (NUDIX family)